VPFLAGLVALIVALVLVVVIRPLGWRLLAALLFVDLRRRGAHRVRERD
jgi:hypothetical protein